MYLRNPPIGADPPPSMREPSIAASAGSLAHYVSLLLSSPTALEHACPVMWPVHPNGSAHGHWQLCCGALPPPAPRECTAVSVGIGDE